MDQVGAARLQWRIEQHTHWQQADAVRAGRQTATDPEREDVQVIAEGIRLYAPREIDGTVIQPCKRLVDGIWVSGVASAQEAEAYRDADTWRDTLLDESVPRGLGLLQL